MKPTEVRPEDLYGLDPAEAERLRRRATITTMAQRILVLLLALLVVLSLVTTVALVGAIRDTQVARLPDAERNDKTLALIRSCTTPGRRCYERGQRQTAAAIRDINRVAVIAAACASGSATRTVEQIQACVIDRLSRSNR